MKLDVENNPFLYSVGTLLSYKIAKHYYHNVHYVWCTTKFNVLKQPPTSNPASICRRYLEQISTGDHNTIEINNNIAGILKGAKEKLDKGAICKDEYEEIRNIVSSADFESFFPVIYIVESKKIKDRYVDVEVWEKASDNSVEYRIEDLKENEFEIISLKDFLYGVLSVAEGKW